MTDFQKLASDVAAKLAEGNVVGWFQGRMEFGPRALGGRSILGDARNPEMQKKLNLKIKYREGFRPFAPSVLEEDIGEYFDLDRQSPYMLLVAPIREDKKIPLPDGYHEKPLYERLYFLRSDLPSITHIDYSARIQSVSQETNPDTGNLIQRVQEADRLRCDREHELQCSWRADCMHPRGRLSVLYEDRNGFPGCGKLSPR